MKEYELDKSTGELTWTYEPMGCDDKDEYLRMIKNLTVSEMNSQYSVPSRNLALILSLCNEALDDH